MQAATKSVSFLHSAQALLYVINVKSTQRHMEYNDNIMTQIQCNPMAGDDMTRHTVCTVYTKRIYSVLGQTCCKAIMLLLSRSSWAERSFSLSSRIICWYTTISSSFAESKRYTSGKKIMSAQA